MNAAWHRRLRARMRRMHWSTWLFLVSLALGLALRVASIGSSTHLIDDDQAILYLIAKRVAIGEWPAYFWNQPYGGTILPILAGLMFLITGPSWVVLSLVGIGFWGVAALLLRQVGIAMGGVLQGNLAAILFWFPATSICPIALFELGRWSWKYPGNIIAIFVGCDPAYPRRVDVEQQMKLARPELPIYASPLGLYGAVDSWLDYGARR